MPDGDTTRGQRVEFDAIELLMEINNCSAKELREGSGIAQRAFSKIMAGEPISETNLKKIADFFDVNVHDLRLGEVSPNQVGVDVLKAYQLVARHFLPGGYFATLTKHDDFQKALSAWSNSDYSQLKLTDFELRKLYSLLRQVYVIRDDDGFYRPLPNKSVDELDLCARLLGFGTIEAAIRLEDSKTLVSRFSNKYQKLRKYQDFSSFFRFQKDLMTIFTRAYPWVHAWQFDCWNLFNTVIDKLLLDGKQLEQFKDSLEKQIQSINFLFSMPSFDIDSLESRLAEYFSTLRRLVTNRGM